MEIDEVLVKENPGVCRCCLSEGCYKDLASEYAWMGDTEVYADMLLDCFDISISQHSDGPNGPNRLICEVCITRLRDACNFKKQVVESEKKFVDMLGRGEFKSSDMVTTLKIEPANDDGPDADVEYLDDMDFDDDSEEEDVPLKHLASTSHAEDVKPKKPRKKAAVVKTEKTIKKEKKKTATKPKSETPSQSSQVRPKKDYTLIRSQFRTIIENTTLLPFTVSGSCLKCFFCATKHSFIYELRKCCEDLTKDHKTIFRNRHLTELRVDETNFTCTICNETMSNLLTFIQHFNQKHEGNLHEDITNYVTSYILDDDVYKCVYCTSTFDHFPNLNKHIIMEHKKGDYVCHICGKTFSKKSNLKTHSALHVEGSYKCPECPRTYNTQRSMLRHKRYSHMSLQCDLCSTRLSSHCKLKTHKQTVHGVEKTLPFHCEVCKKDFEKKSILLDHNKKVHLKVKNVVCNVCGDRFYNTHFLNLHMVSHGSKRPFKCDSCGKTFPRRKALNLHKRIHTNDRRYKCQVCEKSFIQLPSLTLHLRVHHGIKVEKK